MKFSCQLIECYLGKIAEDPYHRYTSWDHCFTAFSKNSENTDLALHLGFYLASWGMYRGSSGLLQKNYIIHSEAVKIIKSEEYKNINYTSISNTERNNLILQLKQVLKDYYEEKKFLKKTKDYNISGTDTLISKILLGTLGCVPAYDRYFKAGIKACGLREFDFNQASLYELDQFVASNEKAILEMKEKIRKKLNKDYPTAKILDMHFWQKGYNTINIQ